MKRALFAALASRGLHPGSKFLISIRGQSNAKVHYDSPESGSQIGMDNMVAELQAAFPNATIKVYESAEGGSFVSRKAMARGAVGAFDPFSDATWNKSGVTTTDNYATGPDGVAGSAARFVFDTAGDGYVADQYAATAGEKIMFACYMKSNTGSDQIIQLRWNSEPDGPGRITYTLKPDEWTWCEIELDPAATESRNFYWDNRYGGSDATDILVAFPMVHRWGEYWVNDVAAPALVTAGPELLQSYDDITNDGEELKALDMTIWAQGESESFQIPDNITAEEVAFANDWLFDDFDAKHGRKHQTIIQQLCKRASGNPSGIWEQKEILMNLAENRKNVHLAPPTYPGTLSDDVHIGDDSLDEVGTNNGRKGAKVYGGNVSYADAPKMKNATLAGKVISLQLKHDGGTAIAGAADKTPASGSPFFRAYDANDAEIPIDQVSVTGGDSVDITLGIVPGSNVTLYGGRDEMIGLLDGTIIKDNTADGLALQEFKKEIAVNSTNLEGMAGLEIYLDAIRSGVTLNSVATDEVEQWNDLSGNANHAVEDPARDRVSYVADRGGYPALYSDGAFAKMLKAPHLASDSDSVYIATLWEADTVTVDPNTSSGLNTLLSLGSATSSNDQLAINALRATPTTMSFVGGSSGSNYNDSPYNGTNFFGAGKLGTDIMAHANGVADSSGYTATGHTVEDHLHLFAENPVSSSRYGIGWMRAAFMFKNVSEAQILEAMRAIAADYGVSLGDILTGADFTAP